MTTPTKWNLAARATLSRCDRSRLGLSTMWLRSVSLTQGVPCVLMRFVFHPSSLLAAERTSSCCAPNGRADRSSFLPEDVQPPWRFQPGILNRMLMNEHRENGLAARLLMTYSPQIAKQWLSEVGKRL